MRQFLVASGACVLPSGSHAGQHTGEGRQASSRPSSSAGSPVSELQTRPPPGVPLDGLVVLTDVFCVPPLDWSVLLGVFFEELYARIDALKRALPAPVRQKGLGRVLLIGPELNPGIESGSDDPEPDVKPDASEIPFPLSQPNGLETRDSTQDSNRVCLELFRAGLASMARTLGQVCAREGLTVNLIDPRGPRQDPGFGSPSSWTRSASLTQTPEFETMTRVVSPVVSSTGDGGLSDPESGSDGRAAALLAKNWRVARSLGIRDILELTGYLLSPWSSSVTGAVFQPTQLGLVALAA